MHKKIPAASFHFYILLHIFSVYLKKISLVYTTSFVWQKIRVITYEKNSFWRKTDKIPDMKMKRLSERMFYSFMFNRKKASQNIFS